MHSLKGIELAVEHARRKRDAQVKAHAQAQRTLASAEVQLQQLQNYANDTDAKWVGSTATATAYTAEVMRHHHQFAGRLQQAIGMQTEVIVGLHHAISEAHTAVLQAEFRLAAIQKLLESRQKLVLHMRDRREQWQSDELATTQFLRNRKLKTLGVPHGT